METGNMKISKQIAALILALTATAAQAWDGPNRHHVNSAARSDMNGGFGFNMSFNGRQRFNADHAPRPVILRGVNFRFDSAELTPESKRNLDWVAASLRNYRGNRLDVSGHASAEGDTMHNLDLSTRRALAVRRYLVMKGVTPATLSSTGYGEMRPIANNRTEQGRSLNRRVELAPTARAF
jgi:outer membrane protein OmpA-like peptidoglycan-associated protein